MKRLTITTLLVCMFAVGCTKPSQKIAVEAMNRGTETNEKVVKELANYARHYVGEAFNLRILALHTDGAEPAVITAQLNEMANTLIQIDWLAMETYTKSREYLRQGQRYIWEQQGWADLLFRDLKAAKEQTIGPKEEIKTTPPPK